jgi:hypothetical protein
MISLTDSKWKELEGGYHIPYDASVPLQQLEQATTGEAKTIFTKLWGELHHQGDVGLASYYAVPHIIRIARERNLHDWNVFGLVATIEIARHSNNPKLPEELEPAYLRAIQIELAELVRQAMDAKWDISLAATLLSALAVSKGHIELAAAILKLEDESLLKEFLETY